jgi:hypothetical protein
MTVGVEEQSDHCHFPQLIQIPNIFSYIFTSHVQIS